ncbi:hypothetical protein BDP55DRAFT_653881 [Colletotrichum godetiae]|uniref:Uncharacterized protein n=1 Tax=Colletotrichum godetiae TaxID=1209918 RepID=A0AAJ0ARF5_9PEZI|nr:uncharacterized protein BDP55DRAFT_653881 [Colletotrichum godetiae]KAK1689009.1 hypothetical protein BDP55DRAFT_653881 [Colletotrichum godetiae]
MKNEVNYQVSFAVHFWNPTNNMVSKAHLVQLHPVYECLHVATLRNVNFRLTFAIIQNTWKHYSLALGEKCNISFQSTLQMLSSLAKAPLWGVHRESVDGRIPIETSAKANLLFCFAIPYSCSSGNGISRLKFSCGFEMTRSVADSMNSAGLQASADTHSTEGARKQATRAEKGSFGAAGVRFRRGILCRRATWNGRISIEPENNIVGSSCSRGSPENEPADEA